MHDLRVEAEDDNLIDRFATDWRTAGLDPATSALLEYCERLTREPATCGQSDVDALRAAGFDDRGVNDATQVIAYFSYINRIAEGLGVDLEDWIDDNGYPIT